MSKIKAILGSLANRMPYAMVPKIGSIYNGYRKDIAQYDSSKDKKDWIFQKMYGIVEYAIKNIPFYQQFYAEKGFDLSMLKSFDDIQQIPVLTKKDLMAVDIEQRSTEVKGRYVANTGGSTGVPLSFYKVYALKVKEMAFYQYAWEKLGYRKHKLRLQFVGRQDAKGCVYELARNEIRVSVYEPFANILREVSAYKVEFFQGYPSVLYEFALYCSQHPEEFEKSGLKKHLKGIFLNSEYPQPMYRKKMEEVFGVPSVASFGHTESCALGFDYGDGNYMVQQAYGYAENVVMADGKHLVATAYDNFVSPLIRYDTNDLMNEAVICDGLLQSFKMTSGGRNGQFVVDANDKRISLTGLIFGKHHALFNYCSQLQISQKEKGKATIYYVPMGELPQDFDPAPLFDAGDIVMDFEFKQIAEPIKTKAGKVMLMVKE